MVLNIPVSIIRELQRKTFTNPLIAEAHCYSKSERIESRGLTEKEFETLYNEAQQHQSTPGVPSLLRTMSHVRKLAAGAGRGDIKDLQVVAEAIRELIGKTEHRWVFDVDDKTNIHLPYIVTECRYVPSVRKNRFYIPAYVSIRAQALSKGAEQSMSGRIGQDDLKGGVTAQHALETTGMLLETPELIKVYMDDMDRYEEMRMGVGRQFLAGGIADIESSGDDDWWYSRKAHADLLVDGRPGKVILDDEEGWGKSANTVTVDDWGSGYFKDVEARTRAAEAARDEEIKAAKAMEKQQRSEDDDLDDEDDDEDDLSDLSAELNKIQEEHGVRKMAAVQVMRVPEHAHVRVFSLHKHVFAETHVANLQDYFYKREIFDKLVLPADIKLLIDALVEDSHEGDDIIEGKGKGAIILLFGPPGCGKTLSAEAYSEKVKKPLYSVQCAQLGTSAAKVEKELATILHRAERWGCLLLIDEADVYIHERGTDVEQNAMVGVFLRLLEYYKGVLFLTTNREGSIDDAIASRCIAEIRYAQPNAEDARRIWQIMFDQYKVKLATSAEKMSARLVSEMPHLSGRTIKHTTRLANLLAARAAKPADVEHFVRASQFQSLERHKEKV